MRLLRHCAPLALLLLLAACASLAPRPDLQVVFAPAEGSSTPLDQVIGEVEARHAGESGFRLVPEGPEAFAVRARGAELAGRSLDVQTYIWHADLTGKLLALRLIQAADRGVKVRLLVDDMDARAKDIGFAAMDAHDNIEVRLFNPFVSRAGKLGFVFEAAGSFGRINRRMHNKSWIVDNRVAVVGGRNLGDEYFGASDDTNFVDLDFAMIGPVVRDVSAAFDRFWNSAGAYPIAMLSPDHVSPEKLELLRTRLVPFEQEALASRFAAELKKDDAVRKLVSGNWPVHWSAKYTFVSDDPLKFRGEGGGVNGSRVLEKLGPVILQSQSEMAIVSPYFVPGEGATKQLVELVASGRSVKILTNSLAANDVAAVYGGYSRWREPLLEGGVQLWELKPLPGNRTQSSLFGSSGASLHTKALVSDRRVVFVGSYNLDPRSTSLNTEQGVLVEDPELAQQLLQLFSIQVSGPHAWKVTLEGDQLFWSDDEARYDKAPLASAWRRMQAWCARALRIDSQL